jgi:hypothetical protein
MKALALPALLVCTGCSIRALAQERPADPPRPEELASALKLRDGRVTAKLHDQTLNMICLAVAQAAHISINVADSISEDRISLDVDATPIDVALRELLREYDVFVLYASTDAPSSVRALWIYPKGGASEIRPVPRSHWAGMQELEASMEDTNPETREGAYKALLDRASTDSRSRSLIIAAIKGVRERDTNVRERLLSTAINKAFPFTADVLADLALSDTSEHIRWMALDTLAYFDTPRAKEVARSAITDISEAVRGRAKEMLNGAASANEAGVVTGDVDRSPEDLPRAYAH